MMSAKIYEAAFFGFWLLGIDGGEIREGGLGVYLYPRLSKPTIVVV